jgi:hypothetical protein
VEFITETSPSLKGGLSIVLLKYGVLNSPSFNPILHGGAENEEGNRYFEERVEAAVLSEETGFAQEGCTLAQEGGGEFGAERGGEDCGRGSRAAGFKPKRGMQQV